MTALVPDLRSFMPAAPDWRFDWRRVAEAYDWARAMDACPQDPAFHAEGDVGIHTGMVCESLAADPAWRALPEDLRAAAFLAAVLHDVAKPATTKTEADGRISSRGHSRRGELAARLILWRMGVPAKIREQATAIVAAHQFPFFAIEKDDPKPLILRISLAVRCDLLAMVAEADARGRRTADPANWRKTIDHIELFRALCAEIGCLDKPYPFPDERAKFAYFRDPRRFADLPVHDETAGRSRTVILSGLPGAGKDTLARRLFPALPVVALDDLRAEMDVDPGDNQGAVIQAGKERVREHLRDGASFVFNATNLSRQIRGQWISLAAAYGARISVVHVEAPEALLRPRNRARAAAVPDAVIDRLLDRWEFPRADEAHEVRCFVHPAGRAGKNASRTDAEEVLVGPEPADPASSTTPII